jgi:hypothetical protein
MQWNRIVLFCFKSQPGTQTTFQMQTSCSLIDRSPRALVIAWNQMASNAGYPPWGPERTMGPTRSDFLCVLWLWAELIWTLFMGSEPQNWWISLGRCTEKAEGQEGVRSAPQASGSFSRTRLFLGRQLTEYSYVTMSLPLPPQHTHTHTHTHSHRRAATWLPDLGQVTGRDPRQVKSDESPWGSGWSASQGNKSYSYYSFSRILQSRQMEWLTTI